MNRVTLIAAAALLGAGCSNHPDRTGSVIFYWQFRDAASVVAGDFTQSHTGCDVAGVDTVRVTIDNQLFDNPCVQSNGVPGAQLFDFTPGTYGYTADGYRSRELVFTTSGSVAIPHGAAASVDLTLDAVSPQGFVIYYDVNGAVPTQCAVNGQAIAGVAYRLEDGAGNVVSTTEAGGGAHNLVACDPTSFGIQIPNLALGTYVLRYLQLVNGSGAAVVQTCATSAPHTGFPLYVNLVNATTTCL